MKGRQDRVVQEMCAVQRSEWLHASLAYKTEQSIWILVYPGSGGCRVRGACCCCCCCSQSIEGSSQAGFPTHSETCTHTECSCWTPSFLFPSIELQVRNPLYDRIYHPSQYGYFCQPSPGQLHKSYKVHGQHPKQQPRVGPQAGLATFLLGAVTGCGCFAGEGSTMERCRSRP